MPLKNACFISYRGYEDNELADAMVSGLYKALKNELDFMVGANRVYRDLRGSIAPGSRLAKTLSRELCESACMVVVYGPDYFSRDSTWCAREFKGMLALEKLRLGALPVTEQTNGLLIIVVFRGGESLRPVLEKIFPDEIEAKYEIARELGKDVPVISILLGGDASTEKELLRVTKQNWPVIVLEGTGQFANVVAEQVDYKRRRYRSASKTESRYGTADSQTRELYGSLLPELITQGNISVFPEGHGASEFEQMVYRCLPEGQALEIAWNRFAAYDWEATIRHRFSRALKLGFLVLGSSGVIAALGPSVLAAFGDSPALPHGLETTLPLVFLLLMTMLFQLTVVLRPDRLAEELRYTAEIIRSEIFRFRSRTGKYRNRLPSAKPPADILLEVLELLPKTMAMERTSTVSTVFEKIKSRIPDDAFGFLTPERYVATRVEDQLNYHRAKISQSFRRRLTLRILMMLSLSAGFIIIILAITRIADVAPSAFAILLVMGMLGAVGIPGIEQRSRISEIVARDLTDLKAWWSSLSSDEKAEPKTVEKLVNETEGALKIVWQIPAAEATSRLNRIR